MSRLTVTRRRARESRVNTSLRCVLRRSLTLLVVASAAMLVSASPSVASYPTIQCTDANYASVYTSPDGEVWVCDYDVDWNDYFWVPLRPGTDPSDAVVYKRQLVTDAQGIQYRVVSRLEWIGYQLYGGVDFHMRTAPNVWYWAPANTVAHKVRAYSWDSATSTWSICRETPWQSYNGSTIGLVTTTAWGNTPCGARWYSLIGYVERQVNGTWTVVTPQGGVSTFGGTTLTGTTTSGSASASNGMIWDPKPGDATKPPKPPKNDKKLGKQDPPKAAPPVPTTGTAAF
jgi:hypothetical protein